MARQEPVSVLCARLGFSILILSSCEITEERHSGGHGDTGGTLAIVWHCQDAATDRDLEEAGEMG